MCITLHDIAEIRLTAAITNLISLKTCVRMREITFPEEHSYAVATLERSLKITIELIQPRSSIEFFVVETSDFI